MKIMRLKGGDDAVDGWWEFSSKNPAHELRGILVDCIDGDPVLELTEVCVVERPDCMQRFEASADMKVRMRGAGSVMPGSETMWPQFAGHLFHFHCSGHRDGNLKGSRTYEVNVKTSTSPRKSIELEEREGSPPAPLVPPELVPCVARVGAALGRPGLRIGDDSVTVQELFDSDTGSRDMRVRAQNEARLRDARRRLGIPLHERERILDVAARLRAKEGN